MHGDLRRFHSDAAAVVCSWVQSEADLFRLAPRTVPPLTPQKVLAWGESDRRQFLLYEPDQAQPCAYGEIRPVLPDGTVAWLGHILVSPAARGKGRGATLVNRLLEQAFQRLSTDMVSLIVFPDNQRAIDCYRRCGLHHTQNEKHVFRSGLPAHTMMRFDVSRQEWTDRRPMEAAQSVRTAK